MSLAPEFVSMTLAGFRSRCIYEDDLALADETKGFQFKYTEGKSAGVISLEPAQQLDPDHLGGKHGHGPAKRSLCSLHPDAIPVEIEVSIQETWTEKVCCTAAARVGAGRSDPEPQ